MIDEPAIDQMIEEPAPAAGPYLSREQILESDDVATEEVEVPEWGGRVLVRSLTGTERDRYEDEMLKGRGTKARISLQNSRARLVQLSVVDSTGRRMFSQADVAALGRKSAGALNRVCDVAQRLSGLRDEDLDELRGNSEDGQDADSPSG